MARMSRGIAGFDDELAMQAAFTAARGVPVYGSLLGAISARPGVRSILASTWADREFHALYERPLLFCAALRQATLLRPAHPLARLIGEGADGQGEVDPALVEDALHDDALLATLRDRFVQTNEVSRSASWRLALSTWPAAPAARVHLVDLGCSAGLNLIGDRLGAVRLVDEAGNPVALDTSAVVVSRTGLDRAPIAVRDDESVSWLRACVWPGQRDRLETLDAAIAQARLASVETRTCLAKDMPAVLARVTAENPDDFVLAYSTVFFEYLLPDEKAAFRSGMHAWLGRTPDRTLWVELEATRGEITPELPAEIRATRASSSAPGAVTTVRLARCDYHTRALADVVRM
jgi:hypothetical protein